ncbi:MAG: AAA family ATPase [Candidatus Aenigmatarchaeota archaeon]
MKAPKLIVAFVGMPGSGKTEATKFLESRGFARVYFGGTVVEEVKKLKLDVNEKNEKAVREELRAKHGMEAMAKLNEKNINNGLKTKNVIIDGLYSLEEYLWLKKKYGDKLIVIALYTPQKLRIKRLGSRPLRPLNEKEVKERDLTQFKNLHTGGPIAIADYTIINEGGLDELKKNINNLMDKLK